MKNKHLQSSCATKASQERDRRLKKFLKIKIKIKIKTKTKIKIKKNKNKNKN